MCFLTVCMYVYLLTMISIIKVSIHNNSQGTRINIMALSITSVINII